MRADRRALAGRGALWLVLAAGWSVAAHLLWRSRVPGSLRLPHLNEHAYFGSAEIRRAGSFARFARADWAAAEVATLAVLAVYARRGVRLMRESAAGPIGTGMLLGMLGFALVWVARLPFGLAEVWWERRHGITQLGYVGSIFGNWAALGGEFVFVSFALLVVMGFARLVGNRWWLPAAPVFVGLALLFAFVSPWLAGTRPLDDPALAAQAAALERAEGISHVPVVVEDVHGATTEPNAQAMGIGPSRRIVLWDTLVDGRFTNAELRVVLAHEIGHLARDHIWKSVGWYALLAFPGTFLIARAARRRGGMARPEAVPLSLLVLVVLTLVAQPLQNVVTRRMESEADWMALLTTGRPAAAAGLFRRFVSTTLSEPDPPTWDYVMFESHPTVMQRLAMVQAWRLRSRR